MKISLMKFTLMLSLTTSLTAWAQSSSSTNKALTGSSWGDKFTTSEDNNSAVSSSDDVSFTSTQVATQSCEKKDQNSVPDKIFFNLLAAKKWNVSHDSSSGKLQIDGGMMISNCNTMLRYNFSQPQSGRPYLFQVEIRKPASCNDGKCKYTIDVAEDPDNPNIKTGTKEIEVEPNYYGYLECLEKSGVIKDGEVQGGKIVPAPFKFEQNGLYSTEEVAFYCHGPECRNTGAKYGEVEVKAGNCDYFSKITETGYTFYSQEDVEKNRKQNLFNKICKSGDYKLIDEQLPEFAGMANLYKVLQEIRNNLLLDEVKAIHKELQAADYSGLDAERYRDTINDFYMKIIKPIQGKIALLMKDPSKNEEKLNELVATLLKYGKEPYLTSADYDNMKSFLKKAPLKKEAWRSAAVSLYSIQNSAYHYSRYSSKVRNANPNSEISTVLTIASANEKINSDVKTEKEFIEKLGQLDADPNKKFSQEHVANANSIVQSKYTNYQDLMRFKQEETQHLYQKCLNPQKYWITNNPLLQRKCIQQVQQNIQGAEQDAMFFNQSQDAAAQHQYNQANMWAQLEAQRNGRAAPAQMQNPYAQGATNFQFEVPGYAQNGQNTQNPYMYRQPTGYPQGYPQGYTGFPQQGYTGYPQQGFTGFQQGYSSYPQGFSGGYTPGFNPAYGGGYTGFGTQGGYQNGFNFTPYR